MGVFRLIASLAVAVAITLPIAAYAGGGGGGKGPNDVSDETKKELRDPTLKKILRPTGITPKEWQDYREQRNWDREISDADASLYYFEAYGYAEALRINF
ncbi:MAG: hypothetical protein AAF530_14995 [Pseudomonadota bacterium]